MNATCPRRLQVSARRKVETRSNLIRLTTKQRCIGTVVPATERAGVLRLSFSTQKVKSAARFHRPIAFSRGAVSAIPNTRAVRPFCAFRTRDVRDGFRFPIGSSKQFQTGHRCHTHMSVYARGSRRERGSSTPIRGSSKQVFSSKLLSYLGTNSLSKMPSGNDKLFISCF